MGVDVGIFQIKAAEIKVIDNFPEVVALRRYPSPPGLWSDQFDEESLVEALREVTNPRLKEVITCIGGEKLISRVVRLPAEMTDKELEITARFELEKIVPVPLDQLIMEQVRLEDKNKTQKETSKIGKEEGQNVLLLAVPAATVYQYYSIFSRAGLVVTAIDLQAFALWRLFGQATEGTLAIVEIGANTTHFIVVKDGLIRFLRLLPVGSNTLTSYFMDSFGLEFPEAQQMKEEAAVSSRNEYSSPNEQLISDTLHVGLLEITRELQRSLEYCSVQENLPAERLILSGGASKLKGLVAYLQDALNIIVEEGIPEISLPEGETFDPAYSVAIGLALRGVVK